VFGEVKDIVIPFDVVVTIFYNRLIGKGWFLVAIGYRAMEGYGAVGDYIILVGNLFPYGVLTGGALFIGGIGWRGEV